QGKLSKIKVLIIPAASHLRAEVVSAVYQFVEQGGRLVMLPSSLLSDEYNRRADYLTQLGIQVRRIEQPPADRTGEIEQAYDQSFHERVAYRSQEIIDLKTIPAGLFVKAAPPLKAQGVRQEITVTAQHQTLAVFPEGHPGLVSLKRGRGLIYYSAASYTKESLSALLDQIFEAAGV